MIITLIIKLNFIESDQNANISVNNKTVLNFCANNYLGLSINSAI